MISSKLADLTATFPIPLNFTPGFDHFHLPGSQPPARIRPTRTRAPAPNPAAASRLSSPPAGCASRAASPSPPTISAWRSPSTPARWTPVISACNCSQTSKTGPNSSKPLPIRSASLRATRTPSASQTCRARPKASWNRPAKPPPPSPPLASHGPPSRPRPQGYTAPGHADRARSRS